MKPPAKAFGSDAFIVIGLEERGRQINGPSKRALSSTISSSDKRIRVYTFIRRRRYIAH